MCDSPPKLSIVYKVNALSNAGFSLFKATSEPRVGAHQTVNVLAFSHARTSSVQFCGMRQCNSYIWRHLPKDMGGNFFDNITLWTFLCFVILIRTVAAERDLLQDLGLNQYPDVSKVNTPPPSPSPSSSSSSSIPFRLVAVYLFFWFTKRKWTRSC